MSITLDSRVTIGEDTVFRELDGEAVLLNLESGMYYGLDEVGTRVWRLFEQTHSLRDTRDGLTAEYDVDAATAERDLLELAEALVAKGLWTVDAGTGGRRQS